MCNLYSVTKGQQAIRELARAMHDRTGNLPPLPGIFPDYAAPIVRNTEDGRELTMARWGMPTPPQYLIDAKGNPRKADSGVTNIRNTGSSHWRRWLGPESRCVVPFTSFSENEVMPNGSRPPIWFALSEDRPLACFAGIWTPWKSVRKVKEGETQNDVFGFLTRAECSGAAISPQGDAGNSDDAGRDRHLDGRAGADRVEASATATGQCVDGRGAWSEGGWRAAGTGTRYASVRR
jgi:putative SOS response-associated peptidase YedK